MREDMTRARNGHLSSLAERNAEITRLSNQLSTRNMSEGINSNNELRVKQLTDSLVQKQAVLEALVSEKNSLVFKIEHIEKSHQEEMSFRSRRFANQPGQEEEFHSGDRRPTFLQESPFD